MTAILELIAKVLGPLFAMLFEGIAKRKQNVKDYYERVKHYQSKEINKIWDEEQEANEAIDKFQADNAKED